MQIFRSKAKLPYYTFYVPHYTPGLSDRTLVSHSVSVTPYDYYDIHFSINHISQSWNIFMSYFIYSVQTHLPQWLVLINARAVNVSLLPPREGVNARVNYSKTNTNTSNLYEYKCKWEYIEILRIQLQIQMLDESIYECIH